MHVCILLIFFIAHFTHAAVKRPFIRDCWYDPVLEKTFTHCYTHEEEEDCNYTPVDWKIVNVYYTNTRQQKQADLRGSYLHPISAPNKFQKPSDASEIKKKPFGAPGSAPDPGRVAYSAAQTDCDGLPTPSPGTPPAPSQPFRLGLPPEIAGLAPLNKMGSIGLCSKTVLTRASLVTTVTLNIAHF